MSKLANWPISPILEIADSEPGLEEEFLDIGDLENEQDSSMRLCSGIVGASTPVNPHRGHGKGINRRSRVECSSSTRHQTVQIVVVDVYNGESVTLQGEGRNHSRPVFAESVPSIGKMDPFDMIPAPSTERVRALIHQCKPRCLALTPVVASSSLRKVSVQADPLHMPRVPCLCRDQLSCYS